MKNTQLFLEAASKGDVVGARELFASRSFGFFDRVDINARNKEGLTPLMTAAARGHRDFIDFLVAKGADVNFRDKERKTALMYATYWGRKDSVDALLGGGADINLQDKSGLTALMIAASRGHQQIVNALLASDADPNIRDKDGDTALTIAASEGHTEIVFALLTNGADASTQNRWGQTALKLANQFGYLDVVSALGVQDGGIQAKAEESGEALRFTVHGFLGDQGRTEVRENESSPVVISQDVDQQLKQCVAQLLELYRSTYRGEGFLIESVEAEPVKEIGKRLDALGGKGMMLMAHTAFSEQQPDAARNLEMVWDGIGGWRG